MSNANEFVSETKRLSSKSAPCSGRKKCKQSNTMDTWLSKESMSTLSTVKDVKKLKKISQNSCTSDPQNVLNNSYILSSDICTEKKSRKKNKKRKTQELIDNVNNNYDRKKFKKSENKSRDPKPNDITRKEDSAISIFKKVISPLSLKNSTSENINEKNNLSPGSNLILKWLSKSDSRSYSSVLSTSDVKAACTETTDISSKKENKKRLHNEEVSKSKSFPKHKKSKKNIKNQEAVNTSFSKAQNKIKTREQECVTPTKLKNCSNIVSPKRSPRNKKLSPTRTTVTKTFDLPYKTKITNNNNDTISFRGSSKTVNSSLDQPVVAKKLFDLFPNTVTTINSKDTVSSKGLQKKIKSSSQTSKIANKSFDSSPKIKTSDTWLAKPSKKNYTQSELSSKSFTLKNKTSSKEKNKLEVQIKSSKSKERNETSKKIYKKEDKHILDKHISKKSFKSKFSENCSHKTHEAELSSHGKKKPKTVVGSDSFKKYGVVVPSVEEILREQDDLVKYKNEFEAFKDAEDSSFELQCSPKDLKSRQVNRENILDCKHLAISDIEKAFNENLDYVSAIIQGKKYSERHEKFFDTKLRNCTFIVNDLCYNTSTIVFSFDQKERLLELMKKEFDPEDKLTTYFFQVLLPELCLKIFMDTHNMPYTEAVDYLDTRPIIED